MKCEPLNVGVIVRPDFAGKDARYFYDWMADALAKMGDTTRTFLGGAAGWRYEHATSRGRLFVATRLANDPPAKFLFATDEGTPWAVCLCGCSHFQAIGDTTRRGWARCVNCGAEDVIWEE